MAHVQKIPEAEGRTDVMSSLMASVNHGSALLGQAGGGRNWFWFSAAKSALQHRELSEALIAPAGWSMKHVQAKRVQRIPANQTSAKRAGAADLGLCEDDRSCESTRCREQMRAPCRVGEFHCVDMELGF